MATTTVVKFHWQFGSKRVNFYGHEDSPQFGAPDSKTQFFLRLDSHEWLTLHLASCPREVLPIAKFEVSARLGQINVPHRIEGRELTLDTEIACRVSGSGNWTVHCTVTYEEIPRTIDHKLKLADNFAAFRLDLDFSDVTLVTDDGHRHPAHKVILSARSPVFAAMFKHPEMTETESKTVAMKGFSGEALVAFLDYIYSAETKSVALFAAELFILASMYQIKPLRRACSKITVDNAAQFYYLADLHKQEHAKQLSLHFIARNKRAVLRSDGWAELIAHNASLLNQLIDYTWN